MELLNLLEEKVQALVSQTERMRGENKRLELSSSDGQQALHDLQEENQMLKATLAQEQRLKDEVLERIDALLERLKDIENDA